MFIFTVQYTESENNTFAAYVIQTDEEWQRFLRAKVPEHLCGYLLTDLESVRKVPELQRRKFYERVAGQPLTDDKELALEHFLRRVEEIAEPLSDDHLRRLERGARGQPKKETKMPKEKAAAAPAERRARRTFDKTAKITVLAAENPRRKNSKTYELFNQYKTGMTVEQAMAKGLRTVDIAADIDRGHIRLDG